MTPEVAEVGERIREAFKLPHGPAAAGIGSEWGTVGGPVFWFLFLGESTVLFVLHLPGEPEDPDELEGVYLRLGHDDVDRLAETLQHLADEKPARLDRDVVHRAAALVDETSQYHEGGSTLVAAVQLAERGSLLAWRVDGVDQYFQPHLHLVLVDSSPVRSPESRDSLGIDLQPRDLRALLAGVASTRVRLESRRT